MNGLLFRADTCLHEGQTTGLLGPSLKVSRFALQAWDGHLPRNSYMRRTMLFFLTLILLALGFTGCGDDKKPVVTTTNAVAFLQEVPNQGATFIPMLGQYATSRSRTVFQLTPALDPAGNAVLGDFGSVSLSRAADQATFDLWGGIGDVLVDQWDIYVASTDGSAITQITDDPYEDYYPQLSPDGTKVIYRSYRDTESGPLDLTVVRSTTNLLAAEQVLPMPPGASATYDATFSPDGTKIAMEAVGYNDVDGSYDGLVLTNADGSNPQLLTNPYLDCDCGDAYPSFTTDGNQIVYTGLTYSEGYLTYADIYIVNADGTGSTVLTDGVGFNFDPVVVHTPGMADKIYFYSDRDNPSASASTGFELYSMNLDGSGLTRLTSNGVFDAFSQEWFVAQGTNSAARIARSGHGRHSADRRSIPRPIPGIKW